MMEYMDSQVGELLDRLDTLGIASQTLVVFVADNGTHPLIVSTRDGVTVQGGKGSTLDAGTHVPLILRWSPQVKPSTVSAQIVDLTDVFATVASAAGQARAARSSDGYDLLRGLTDRRAPRRSSIFMDFSANWWPLEPVRYAFTPQWKLYDDGRYYDTNADPLEARPLMSEQLSDKARDTQLRLRKTLDGMGDHAMSFGFRRLNVFSENFVPYPRFRGAVLLKVVSNSATTRRSSAKSGTSPKNIGPSISW